MRGYGESELPPEYDEPPDANAPPLSFEREACDLLEVTRWLREERAFDRLHYVGPSGGTDAAFLRSPSRRIANACRNALVGGPPTGER